MVLKFRLLLEIFYIKIAKPSTVQQVALKKSVYDKPVLITTPCKECIM